MFFSVFHWHLLIVCEGLFEQLSQNICGGGELDVHLTVLLLWFFVSKKLEIMVNF